MKKIILIIASVLFLSFISLSQNVGIGTTTPLYKLDVRGSINTDSLYRIAGNTVLSINGMQNTFLGVGCGSLTSIGLANTGIGYHSLFSNAQGNANTAFGTESLYSNTSGISNTAVGYRALMYNTNGLTNTAIGELSLYSNTTGKGNIAIGHKAMYVNKTGQFNVVNGNFALYSNTTGDNNTVMGAEALYYNTTGSYNTVIGFAAHQEAIGSLNYYNTAVGAFSLLNTTNAQYNTNIGYRAGDSYDNGYNNVFVGANTDVNAAGLFNVIAMGQGTIVTSGSSTARFGNAATVSYGGWAGWSNISDGRFKKDVREDIPGIDFINRLRPVTYHVAASELDAFLHKNDTTTINLYAKQLHTKALNDKEKIRYAGFIAQEVEAATKELGFDFSGVDAPKNENDTYGLRYAEFVVPLVKAVQELSKQNEELKKQNLDLIKRMEKLELLTKK